MNRLPRRNLVKNCTMNINGYQIIKELGSGGFGTTYLAEKDNYYYAIKKIKADRGKQAFDREISMLESMADFCSDNFSCGIEVIYDINEYYIVSDYIYGKNANQFFKEIPLYFKGSEHYMIEYFSFKLLKDIGEALLLLHENKIIHMDIKPDNIIYDNVDEKFKLIDFGLAINLNEDYSYMKNKLIGTPGFVNPFILVNWDGDDVFKNDSFSLAATVFILNENRYPFPFRQDIQIYDISYPLVFNTITSKVLQKNISILLNDTSVEEMMNQLSFIGYPKYQ